MKMIIIVLFIFLKSFIFEHLLIHDYFIFLSYIRAIMILKFHKLIKLHREFYKTEFSLKSNIYFIPCIFHTFYDTITIK